MEDFILALTEYPWFQELWKQTWFQVLASTVLFCNSITAVFKDEWVEKIPVIGKIWPVLNWLSMNVFNNMNHPKGMQAAKDEIKKIKIANRESKSAVIDGL